MKTKNIVIANLLTLASLSLGTAAVGQSIYSDTFDTTSSPMRYDFGNAISPTVTWASGPTYDAGGSAGSGSAKLNWSWNGTVGGANFTGDFIYPAANYAGATVSFSMYVDSSSTPGAYNDYGYFKINTRYTDSYTYGTSYLNESLVGGAVSAVGQWQQVSFVLGAEASTLRALTFQDYNDAGRAINGPETIYIDNVTITPVPEPSALAFGGLGIAALCMARWNKAKLNA